MKLTVLDCEQGSEAWYRARIAMPTASRFSDVLAEGKGISRRKYLMQLAGEKLTGRPMDSFKNGHMARGVEREPIIRAEYEWLTGNKVERVGFIHNNSCGCSPDGLVAADGLIEIKDVLPHIFVEIVLRDAFPSEHKAQVQGSMMITERKWCDLIIGCEGAPLPYIRRTFPDATYIRELESEIERFNKELRAMTRSLKC